MKWLVSGDCHGNVTERLDDIAVAGYDPKETNVILLGDVGLNFWLNKSDINNKKRTNARDFNIWCVRGNHEQRPSLIPTIQWSYDEEVKGLVGVEPEFPNIHYFKDEVGEYTINGYKCLIIPGAFSVDGEYRRQRALSNGWCGWFADEQLTPEEMEKGKQLAKTQYWDFIFSHTCPYSVRPKDLFLPLVDQSTVDYSMEHWLDTIKDETTFGVWCWGHYHTDRIEKPYFEQFYYNFEPIEDIAHRWQSYYQKGSKALQNTTKPISPYFSSSY